jgi:hypothetical protein
MNAVEIEEAISALAERPFDRAEFPYAFLEAFGNKEPTLRRLRSGTSNKSDIGGVLQTNNIHIATCEPGAVTKTRSRRAKGFSCLSLPLTSRSRGSRTAQSPGIFMTQNRRGSCAGLRDKRP